MKISFVKTRFWSKASKCCVLIYRPVIECFASEVTRKLIGKNAGVKKYFLTFSSMKRKQFADWSDPETLEASVEHVINIDKFIKLLHHSGVSFCICFGSRRSNS
jgi:hypothetical protein